MRRKNLLTIDYWVVTELIESENDLGVPPPKYRAGSGFTLQFFLAESLRNVTEQAGQKKISATLVPIISGIPNAWANRQNKMIDPSQFVMTYK